MIQYISPSALALQSRRNFIEPIIKYSDIDAVEAVDDCGGRRMEEKLSHFMISIRYSVQAVNSSSEVCITPVPFVRRPKTIILSAEDA
jgi:hypothetical protein